MTDPPLVLTGASGALGGRVARQLADREVPMRLVVRDLARAPQLPGAEVVRTDLGDEEAMRAAFDGARTVLLVSAEESPDRQQLHEVPVRAAAAAGIERVVYTSFLGAAPAASFPYARDHAHTEVAIREAGMALTALRNSLYADIVPHLVGDDGVVRGPAGDGRCAWVAREDIARLAVATLLDDVHAHRIYDVTGPEPLDLHETVRLLGRVTGRGDLRYVPETITEARASRAGAADWMVEGWIGSYLAIDTGELGVTSHTIEAVTGRRPLTFGAFLDAEPDAWRHLTR
ncbi:SDR family oxidoreductase [Nitriliruptor alkaliphilus]|uniref:SDR family oxidoreductase n=1 Tax=Nitriliruptor alkaliphilus TaxID=427918 RepID=UPI00069724E7|nr:SDR family oxidoreductase [Nitriliruptor alkaliphilus]